MQNGIESSNPPPSAIQSQLQRNPGALPLKYAKKADFSGYFLNKPDQRK
jgi:hypothetical protein